MFYLRKKFFLTFLFLQLLLTSFLYAQQETKSYGLMLKAGYGGIYLYQGKIFSGATDNISFGADMLYNNHFGISLNYDQSFLFRYFDSKKFTLAFKYFPFSWYNQPFIGLGYTSGNYQFGQSSYYQNYYLDNQSGSHNGLCVIWGFNIQFPKNVYVIFETTNIFSGYTGIESNITQTIHVIGTLGYRINFKCKSKSDIQKS